MERIPVSSSNLCSVGYDPGSQTLEIEFNHGGVYQYAGVPEGEYEGLMSACSLNAHSTSPAYARFAPSSRIIRAC